MQLYQYLVILPLFLDIVFFIFLYQRWIYRVDPHRVNEFGTSGDSVAGKPQQKLLQAANEGDTERTSGSNREAGSTKEGEMSMSGCAAGPRVGADRGKGGAVRHRTTAANKS